MFLFFSDKGGDRDPGRDLLRPQSVNLADMLTPAVVRTQDLPPLTATQGSVSLNRSLSTRPPIHRCSRERNDDPRGEIAVKLAK